MDSGELAIVLEMTLTLRVCKFLVLYLYPLDYSGAVVLSSELTEPIPVKRMVSYLNLDYFFEL